jgi:PAS domain S-box-containing protein
MLAYRYADESVKEKERLHFEAATKQAAMLVQNRMDAYRQILYAGAALFDSSASVERDKWRSFVKALKIDQNFPGIQGVGFSEVVYPKDKAKHIARIKAEGFADYSIRPEGERDIYTSIIYLEPFNERNKRAFGYDMFSEEIRREAMIRAVFDGQASLSGKVRLVQENNIDEQVGFLMYVPIYFKNMPLQTKEQRMVAIKGFVYAPFRAKDLMNGVLGTRYKDISLEIYDGDKIDKNKLLFPGQPYNLESAAISTKMQLNIDGKVWTLYFRPLKGFLDEVHTNEPWFVLAIGLLLSFSLFFMMLSLINTKERAQALADKMTEQLSLSEERLRFALEGSGDGIWDWNIETNEVFFSKRWKEMLGFAEDEIEASLDEWKKRVHPDDLAQVFEDVKKHFEGKSQVYTNEHRVKCKDGSYKWILARGLVAAKSKNGAPTRMVGSNTDISAQKIAEDELIKINEHLSKLVEEETAKRIEKDKLLIQQSKLATMGEMIGAIGHQWRQPLNSLGLMIQDTLFAYKYGEMDEEYLKNFKEHAMETIQTMSKTIDDFKNFFSPNKKEEQFFLEDAIAQTIKILDAQLKNNSIEVIFDKDSIHKHPYVCYKNELNQVILNILANAKDALIEKKPQTPFIKIDVECVGDGCEIAIEDSAGGIPSEIIEKVFEPYFTTKEEGKGTGIGLYMSKDIVDEHLGGKISVENSENGARFTIWLPQKSSDTPKEKGITSLEAIMKQLD